MLITISGIDGSGKSTLATAVENSLVLNGIRVKQIEFPCSKVWTLLEILEKEGDYFSNYGTDQDKVGFSLNLERLAFMHDIVLPNLLVYQVVILQRYIVDFASIGKAQGATNADINLIIDMDKVINTPKIMFCLNTPHEVAYQRIINRGLSSDIRESKDFHKQLSNSYTNILNKHLFDCVQLDGCKSMDELVSIVLSFIK